MQKMLSGRAPLDSHVGGVQDVQSWLPGFHAFRFSLCLTCRMCKNEFQFDLGFCPCINTSMGKKKSGQGKVGGWHSPRPKSETLLFGGSICFVLLFFCCFVVFFLVCCFFAFYFTIFQFFFAVSHTKYPNLKVPNSDRNLPFRLTA